MVEIDKNNDSNEEINTSNIFDEFEIDDDTREEINKINAKKGVYHYMSQIGNIVKYINIVLFFILMIAFSYIFIQTKDSAIFRNKAFLNPICSMLNGNGIMIGENCSGVTSSLIFLDEKTKNKEISYLKTIIPILENSYEIESVNNSKKVLFLADKKENKNDPIEILNEFDKLKNKFTPIKKSKIRCDRVTITGNILRTKCSSYSTAWYDDIPGKDGSNKVEGTSITLASSFINFLGNSNNFNIINKQKKFSKNPFIGEGEYTYKTDFNLELEYNKTDLSLK